MPSVGLCTPLTFACGRGETLATPGPSRGHDASVSGDLPKIRDCAALRGRVGRQARLVAINGESVASERARAAIDLRLSGCIDVGSVPQASPLPQAH